MKLTDANKRKTLTKNERLQLIGLCTIARTEGNLLESIKQSFMEILGEPYLGEDLFWEIVYGSENVIQMIDNKEFKRRVNVKGIGL